jgi:hypothetical protein
MRNGLPLTSAPAGNVLVAARDQNAFYS